VTSAPAGNFATLLAAAARRRPEHPALVWDGGTLSWRELEGRAAAMARRLAGEGVGAGDVVAVLLPNTWALAAALWGGLALGATMAPLNPLLAGEERGRILGHLGPKAVVDAAPAEETAASMTIADADAPGIILYTSGSTGQPKGAVLSHAALAIANESWAGPVMELAPSDRVLAALPLAHSFGLNGALLAPLLAGVTVVLQERFSPEETLRSIGRHRVTVFPGVATMFARILESPALAGADLSSLRLAVSGAAPCPWPLASEWRRRTGVRVVRGYGMTELFRPISYLAAETADLPDSIGRAVPGVELRLVDDELWIRTPAAMDGYLRAPEETAAVLDDDGWFKTGDLAAISAEGFVSIVGRKRELILRGGYSVVPGEVEAALLGHPAVAEAAVVGVAHAELGEDVAAFVTLRARTAADPDELIAFCRERLAGYKYPRRITIVDELPKSATGKILKAKLREPSA
jgi:long-chain acyl-CoA synthetase